MKYIYLIGNIDLRENSGAVKHFTDLYNTLKLNYKYIRVFVRELPAEIRDEELYNFVIVPYFHIKRIKKWGTLFQLLSFELALFFKLLVLNFSDTVKGIYLRQSNLNFAVPLFSRLFNKKLFIESNSLILEDYKEASINSIGVLERKLEKFSFNNALHIRVITTNMKSFFINTFGLEESKFSVIPNGFAFREQENSVKKVFTKDLLSGEFQLLYVGLLHKREGIHILIKALTFLNTNILFKLKIIGEGPHQELFEYLVRTNNLEKKVQFIGAVYRDKLEPYYKNADICLAPLIRRRNEVTGISPVKIFEYMAHKCPVICSDLPGLEFVGEHRCGIVVEPDSPALLAEKIEWLMNNYNTEAETIATNGYNYTKENHNWQKLSQEIISRCNQVFE